MSPRRRQVSILAAATASLIAMCVWPVHDPSVRANAVTDAGHMPVFGGFTLLLWWVVRSTLVASRGRALALAIAISVVMSGLTEAMQLQIARNADPHDFLHDLVGVGVAALLVAGRARRVAGWPRAPRLAFRATVITACVTVVAVSLAPLVEVLTAYRDRDAQFPLLLGFENAHERIFLRSRHAHVDTVDRPDAAAGGGRSGALHLGPGTWPAVVLTEPFPDWRGYDALEFEVFSPEPEPSTLYLRIDDEEHDGSDGDRFGRILTIAPGPNRLRIPLESVRTAPHDREMDLARMRSVTFFVPTSAVERVLLLDEVRLTRAGDLARGAATDTVSGER